MMINIICFGNALCSDDGVGYLVFKLLEKELTSAPKSDTKIRLFYAGNSGQKALPLLMSGAHLIVVDALMTKQHSQPGVIHCFTASDLKEQIQNNQTAEYSSHALDLNSSWQIIELLSPSVPELTVYAIEIENAQPYCEQLSGPVESAAHRMTQQIMQQCHVILANIANSMR